MLVCHCRGVFDREIRQAVREGAETLEEVGEACGAGAGCGGCQDAVAEIIDAERAGKSCARVPVVHSKRPLSLAPEIELLDIVRRAS